DGQYAGFRWLLTPSSIIDLFYDKLSITDMEEIEAMVNPMIAAKGKRQSTSTGAISYDTQTFSDSFGNINEHNLRTTFDMIYEYQRFGESSFSGTHGLIKVIRSYWQSYREIGWLTSYDENDKEIVEMVDENYTA